jgi:GTP-binding protein
MTGKSGEHKIIDVPIGTLIRRPTDYLILADLDRENSMFIAARGGAGGKGNHFFLSDKNRHPQVAEVGGKGQDNQYILEMKTVADVGLIGLPNVGKSTLLRAVSRARPRVASYPFTTLNPYVGVIEFEDYVQMSIADLPGLIEGAHQNRGLGIDFLKHVERCTCLIFVLDLSISEPWHQLLILKNELEKFKPGLSRRPHAIIGNKYDDSDAEYNLAKLKEFIEEATPENVLPLPVVPISAKYGVNVQDFLNHIRGLYDLYQVEQNPDDE